MELNIFSLAGVAIAGAVLSLVIRKNNPTQSFCDNGFGFAFCFSFGQYRQ